MSVSLKSLKDQVVVVTGASSGIGLAFARLACHQGAAVVLASRNADVLHQVERELTAAGGRALAVPTDVSREAEVVALAAAAVARFGRIDTWVNDAGLGIFGRLEQVADADSRRMFDTNFWGLVYGSLEAVKQFKAAGYGKLVNLGSVASDTVLPLQVMYCATKHAIKAFTDGLRMELQDENAPISVTLIRPAAIDTPFPEHAGNYLAGEPKLPAPVYPVDEVAKAIAYACEQHERDIYVGGAGRAMSALNRRLPRTFDLVGAKVLSKQMEQAKPGHARPGALYAAGRDGDAKGNHPGYVRKTSFYTEAVTHPLLTAALAVGAGLVAAALFTGAADDRR